MSDDRASDPVSAREAALARLIASRAALRQELITPPDPGLEGHEGSSFNLPRRAQALWRALRRSLRGSPMAGIALAAVQQWWERHPWRMATEIAADELQAIARPLIRRHPVASTLLAAAAGAALLSARPWRWPLVAKQFRPLPGRMGRWLFNQLGAAPGQALLASVLAMLAEQRAKDQERDRAADAAADAASTADAAQCQPRPTSEPAPDR